MFIFYAVLHLSLSKSCTCYRKKGQNDKKIIGKNGMVHYFYYYNISSLSMSIEIFQMETCSLYIHVYTDNGTLLQY